jgi:hypothetical protein
VVYLSLEESKAQGEACVELLDPGHNPVGNMWLIYSGASAANGGPAIWGFSAGTGSVGMPQSGNRYAYVLNDPINSVDLWGLCTGFIGRDDGGNPIFGEVPCHKPNDGDDNDGVSGSGGGGGGGGDPDKKKKAGTGYAIPASILQCLSRPRVTGSVYGTNEEEFNQLQAYRSDHYRTYAPPP